MIKIDNNMLDELCSQAKSSPRKRKNRNFHSRADDRLQRMLNAIEPGSYIQPHKHENPDKREAFFALRGIIAIIEYDDEGHVANYIILDARKGNYGAEVAPGIWHSMISLQSGSVAYEIKDGPYDPDDDKEFAAWAPAEGSPQCKEYLNKIETLILKEI